jgi:hypothetical protein
MTTITTLTTAAATATIRTTKITKQQLQRQQYEWAAVPHGVVLPRVAVEEEIL